MTNWPVAKDRDSGLELVVGHSVDWHEPGWPTFLEDQPHAYATREIVSAPTVGELSTPANVAAWEAIRGAALGMLANAALMPGCSAFEVRYVAKPGVSGAARIHMFISARARDWQPIVPQTAVAAACNQLPPGFAWSTPENNLGFGVTNSNQLVLELRRDEEVTIPQWDYVPAEFYYTINDDPGDGSGWPAFWRSLSNTTQPVTVSLLFQRSELHWDERNILGGIISDLALFSEPRTDYDILNNPVTYPACLNAKAALASWQQRIEQLNRPLLARLAVRGEVTSAVSVATALATAIGTTSGHTGSRPMLVDAPQTPADQRQAAFGFDWLEILPWGGHGVWADEAAPNSLRRMPYLFGLNEAAGLLVLPVPDEQGVAGMPLTRRVATQRETVPSSRSPENGLRLGSALHHGNAGSPLVLPLAAVNRHALIVGAPGSGKTTTVLSLLVQLWRDHQIPFLVIESVKTEYRSLIGTPDLEDLQIITLGNERLSPLRLNPLEPPPGVRCEVHRSTVMASLKMALPLFPPLPQLLDKALGVAYDKAGWDDDTTTADGLAAPTLRDLLNHFREVFTRIGYRGDAENIGLAFQTRLESLLQGSRGKLLDTVQTSDFVSLLRKPTVIEMNDIQDADERAVLAAFILDRVRAGAKSRGSSGGVLRHVTVIEEAHRLLARASVPSGDNDSGDKQRSDSVRAFCEAIAELRSLGEGFILSSQSPSALADAAVANTGARILHRMESSVDRKIMLDDLDASDLVRQAAARLRKGEAVVRWPELDEVELVQVEPIGEVDSGRYVPNDVVAEHMYEHRRQTSQLLPYQLCSSDVCIVGCLAKTRRWGANSAEAVGEQAGKLWSDAKAARRDAVGPIADLLAEKSGGELQLAYCGAVHLSINGEAFRQPGTDDRLALIQAMRQATNDGS
jgi:hypothetical protein